MSVKISEIINHLESLAPRSSQEDYDNSGLICGSPNTMIQSALICLDSIETIIDEAISLGCGLVIAHHPIVFKGLKTFTGKSYVERVVLKCIQNNIALYAIHTNLDNYQFGVNFEISQRLELKNTKILAPKEDVLKKLAVFIPQENAAKFSQALFEAGAGNIGNYSECSFLTAGTGTFKPNLMANPVLGQANQRSSVDEVKLEFIVSSHQLYDALNAMKQNHPYEEIAFDVFDLKNTHPYEGAGMIGELEKEVPFMDFLTSLKKKFNCGAIRYTSPISEKVKKIAICGGSGSFLLQAAMRQKADIFITADFKYHEFFDAEHKIVIADIGHFESEQFTINLLERILKKKFPNFAVHLTGINTNPINYL